MNDQPRFHTRREFLGRSLLGGAFAATVPAFLANTFGTLDATAAESDLAPANGRDANILVILQMAGGNDGLNTLVPFVDDHYRRARPTLGVPTADVLRLNDSFGLHPTLTGLKDLYDEGHLAIIQGIGYPNPNRSHFRSTEIWQTASDTEKFEKYGWLGRYFDNACPGADPTVGVSVGRQMPQAFAARTPKGISLESPGSYRFLPGDRNHPEGMAGTEESYRKMNEMEEHAGTMTGGPETSSGGSIGAIHGNTSSVGSPLDFLERTALDAQVSSERIAQISQKAKNNGTYPTSQLANSLKLVARLIAGGLPTRVYYVSQGGYDTHTNQVGAQPRLLRELGDSLKAFLADLKVQGNLPRVRVMTFSEFGRRVAENASGGTDHGAAAPLFLLGGGVPSGFYGQAPSLAPADLINGDLAYHVDFRSLYAGVLEDWLKTPSAPILGRQFPPLRLT